jgi:hypothetical protein
LGFAFLLSLGPVLKIHSGVVSILLPQSLLELYNQGMNWLGTHSFAAETYSLAQTDRMGSTHARAFFALVSAWWLGCAVLAGLLFWLLCE